MKMPKSLNILSFTLYITLGTIVLKTEAQDREFYQLKIYALNTEKQVKATDQYLKNAFIPALKNRAFLKWAFSNPDRTTRTSWIKYLF